MRALWPLITAENASEVCEAVLEAAPGLPRKCMEAMDKDVESAMSALGALTNLAVGANMKCLLCQTPGLVAALVRTAQAGATDDVKLAALVALSALALDASNMVPLCNTPNLVPLLVNAARSGATDNVKEVALNTLSNLAVADDNQLPLAQSSGLVDALVVACSSSRDGSRRSAIAALHGLSTSGVATALLDTPAVVAALSTRLKDANIDTQLRAAMALASLVGGDEARSYMLTSDSTILRSIVGVLHMSLDVPGSWEFARPLHALRSLCLLPSNRAILVKNGLPALLVRAVATSLEKNDARARQSSRWSRCSSSPLTSPRCVSSRQTLFFLL